MRLLGLFCLVGCASANVGRSGGDDVQPPVDAAEADDDAPPPADAPPQMVTQTLSETTSNQNTASNSATCAGADGTPPGQNSWYRVFRPSDFGITGAFNVTQVTFGAQEAANSPVVQVKVGTYTGTFGAATLDLTKVTPLNSTTATIPNLANPGNSQVAPITATIPPGSDLIVELFVPTNDVNAKFFFMGASNAGETKPGYLRAPDCVDSNNNPITTPTSTAAIGAPQVNLIITVTGTHN